MISYALIRRILAGVFLLPLFVYAQASKPLPPGEIVLQLKKLNVLGTALHIAAHPDDENTAMLAWLAKGRLVRTGYLSLTRGDGGQNLIGPEQSELMGLIRTYELLGARSIDGAEQFFTPANDFGFSKNTEETLDVWGKDAVLGDVVWRIRKFRPDVIICRFPPDSRAGHGNHSASAALAEEAFKLAGDPTKYPEQLKYVKPWQPKRILWNTFAFGLNPAQRPAEGSWISEDLGQYNPLLASSFTEIAAESRSQHKSQGFGVSKTRGVKIEYFVHKDGQLAKKDLFDDVDITWNRVKGGKAIQAVIDEAIRTYHPENPASIIPLLVKVYRLVNQLDDAYWKEQKKTELTQLLVACAGLWYETNPSQYAVADREAVKITSSIIKRSDAPVTLYGIRQSGFNRDTTLTLSLPNNELQRFDWTVKIPDQEPITQPYWLRKPKLSKGRYQVDFAPAYYGLPTAPEDLQTEFLVNIGGLDLELTVPIRYKYTDEVRGELYRPFEIRPQVTATPAEKVLVFADGKAKTFTVNLKGTSANSSGTVSLQLPTGWQSEPASISFSFNSKFQEQMVQFQIIPPAQATEGSLNVLVQTGQEKSNRGIYEIKYQHIPALTVFPIAETKLVRLNIKNLAKTIGYIPGAGDEVPAALREMGCQVTMLGDKELNSDLNHFDAIVVGIRAYNINRSLVHLQPKLMEYVKQGGTMVVQYQVNTNLQHIISQLGPYPFQPSRERVTVEEAPVRFLKPQHPVLNQPNKLTDADFAGWVQERGLYFPDTWDSHYDTIISSNDPGEKPLDGGLLVTPYGKGYYAFTGYAFFRQVPAGVPGAYRLFANLISLGK
ncbi:MAG: PIG-L family deacetylase [Siphonobacter sp.]